MIEKVLFLGEIFEMEILMDLHVMRAPESENHILSIWSVCMCICVSVISITQKQITAEHQIWYSTFESYTDTA